MDDYADVYYVDTRNADHRTGSATPAGGSRAPAQGTRVYLPQRQIAAQQPMYYPPPPSAMGMFFGKLTTGQVVDMVAQLFAVLQPLPTAPTATRDAGTDVGNLILYQGALAQHAKRDEQVRTLGSLVGKVVG